ncbi:transcription factor S [Halalkalicoccus salilacus]|uniref:transcription factor S n=1 Tax=Halalkalicoccus salilacus TaxID=3117459 RepID=UPI00300F276D
MRFCESCGSMMKAEGEKWVCGSCGETTPRDRESEAGFVSTEEQTGDELIETEEGAEFEGKPTAKDVRCEECGNTEAWYTIKQTGAADEPPTRFFKCKECGYRWREYN